MGHQVHRETNRAAFAKPVLCPGERNRAVLRHRQLQIEQRIFRRLHECDCGIFFRFGQGRQRNAEPSRSLAKHLSKV